MDKEEYQKNVLGEKLESCSADPLTGWFRDGCCNTNETDLGLHTVCAKVTKDFLEWSKNYGNDLITWFKRRRFLVHMCCNLCSINKCWNSM